MQEAHEFITGERSTVLVVGPDKTDEIAAGFAFEGGVDDHDGNVAIGGALHGASESDFIEGGEDDRGYAGRNELLNKADLLSAEVTRFVQRVRAA